MGGWHISHKANETETVYKFHRSLKIAPGATVTVFSAGTYLLIWEWCLFFFFFSLSLFLRLITVNWFICWLILPYQGTEVMHNLTYKNDYDSTFFVGTGVTHEPPATLVMKEQRWFVADRMVTHLFNNDGDVNWSFLVSLFGIEFKLLHFCFVGNGYSR